MSGVEVGTAYVTVLPSTQGFHKALADETSRSAGAAGQQAGGMFAGGFSKALPAIGGAMAGVFSVRAVAQFAGEAITAASDLAESQSKVAVVFGQSADAINAWAETSASSLLMTQQQALEAAGTYGNLFQAFGIGQQQAQSMSTTLVQLAADLASFNNTSVDDALLALRSGLSGETEPLKRFGVALTDARLKAAALEQGIWDGVGTLDAGQKATAAYAVIMQDTALAQGDVERTADGYANTMRRLTADVENAKTMIGTELVGALQDVSTALGGADSMSTGVSALGDTVADLVAGVGALGVALAGVNGGRTADSEGMGQFWQDMLTTIPFLGPGARALVEWGDAQRSQAEALDAVASEAERAAYMQDIYSGKTGSSAVEMSNAGKAAEAYAAYLDGMTQRTLDAAGAQASLADELERYNRANDERTAGVGIRDQWRALDTMGERVWRGKGKDRRQVQLDFDPTVKDGRLGTDATGDKARQWAVRLADAYMAKADLLGGQEAEDLLARGRKRLGRQFAEWGIENPADYAASFLRTPASLVTRNNIASSAMDPAGVSDEARRVTYNFYGDIKADSPQAAATWAQQQARAAANSRVPHGAAPVGAP